MHIDVVARVGSTEESASVGEDFEERVRRCRVEECGVCFRC